MSGYGRSFATRLFIQAAFTGLLAPISSHGSTWLMVTFAVAGAAVAVGAVAQSGHARLRELIVAFEVAAVAVGVVGLLGHHYIPGTIVGIATLITVLNHAPARAVPATPGAVPAPVPVATLPVPPPVAIVPAHPAAAPAFAEPVPPLAAVPADMTFASAPPPAPVMAPPPAPVPAASTLPPPAQPRDILPGR